MPRKPIELPPDVAAFVAHMRAFFAEPNLIKRDEIAARQMSVLRQKRPRQACCATPAQDQQCWNAAAFEQSQFFDHTGQKRSSRTLLCSACKPSGREEAKGIPELLVPQIGPWQRSVSSIPVCRTRSQIPLETNRPIVALHSWLNFAADHFGYR
jgi:hypothetical protein